MATSWGSVLERYSAQHFQVFTREDLLHASFYSFLGSVPVPSVARNFLQNLSRPTLSIGEAFYMSVFSVDDAIHIKDVFPPLKRLMDQVTHVAVVYGEHFAWKSPDKWSYLFHIRDALTQNMPEYIIAHAPATPEQIQQVEAILGIHLPPTYVHFLKETNGLGLAFDELQYIHGVGDARAAWADVIQFQALQFQTLPGYHEIASSWLQWQDVLVYERQRDTETGINTFQSDKRICVPFAYTFDDWCFDRSQQNDYGEYPVLLWDHELRKATFEYCNFETWFTHVVTYDSRS